MEIRILGPLEVHATEPIEVRRPMDRALLTMLAAEVGRPVSSDRLIDGLWGESPPPSARRTLRTYVHHLRSLLPADAVVTQAAGYRLDPDLVTVDAGRFEAGVDGGGALLEADANAADRLLGEALSLWRGEPFSDAPRAEWLMPERIRLEAMRLRAVTDTMEARLRLGRHEAATPALRSLAEEHPLREDIAAMLMLALYRGGRQAEALRAYRTIRHSLAEELGIDPGPELQTLEARILDQDPSLSHEPEAAMHEAAPAPPPEPMAPGRRLVTLLLARLTGSHALKAALGPVAAGHVVSEALAAIDDSVANLGGTFTRRADTEVLAVFGLPVAREDDAYRAIDCGLDIRSRIAEQALQVAASWDCAGLGVSIAVQTTPTVASIPPDGGELPGAESVEQLLAAADPGDVLVDDRTRRGLDDLFAWGNDPVPVPATGRSAWRARAVRLPMDKARMARRLHAPLVGRDAEVRVAAAALEALDRGVGGVMIVRGEAGVGKTRLLQEMRTSRGVDQVWLIGHGASYAEPIPYWPIRDMLRGWLDLGIDDTELKSRVVLRTRLEETPGVDADVIYPYLAGLLGLTLEAEYAPRLQIAPEALRYRTFEVVAQLIEALAQQQPLTLVVEDIHWVDSTSLQLVETLLPLTDTAAVLVVLTTRFDPDHPSHLLGEHIRRALPHRHTDLHLGALDDAAQKVMLDGLVGSDALPDATIRRVLDLAEGNPFYLEELIGSLIDAGALVSGDGEWSFDLEVSVAVPETIEKVVQARIDRLDPEAHRILTAAAVLGRSFGLPLLQGTVHGEGNVLAAVQRLLRLDLLLEARRWPQAEYLFKHALIQEAAYRTLPDPQRRELHRRAAAWLEDRYEDNLDEVAGHLARHWTAAGDEDQSIAALVRAGDIARRDHALDTAIEHYRTLLPMLERRGERRSIALALFKLAHALHTSLRFAEADAAYQQAFAMWDVASSPEASATLRYSTRPLFKPGDPIRSYALQDIQLQMAMFDRLVERWPDDTLVPSLAERWEVSGDGLVYRFVLREGLRWSDGHPLTADDAAYGLLRNLDPNAPGISVAMLYVIENAKDYVLGRSGDLDAVGVNVLDDRTLEIRLNAPAPYFLSMLNRPDCGPQPRHTIEERGEGWAEPDHEVLSGAFRRDSVRDDLVVLTRRPDYQGMRFGNVNRVEWRLGEESAGVAAYLSGELDLLWLALRDAAMTLDEVPKDHLSFEPVAGLVYLLFDFANPLVRSQALRRSLAHSIDRTALAGLLGINEVPATGGIVPPALAGHTPDIAPEFDPELAGSLVAGARVDGPLRIATLAWLDYLVEAVADMWRTHLGLAVEVDVLDISTWLGMPGTDHPYAAYPGAWYPGYTDPEYFLRLLLESDAMDNMGGFSHPPYDDLLRRAISARDERERLELFHAADRMAVADEVAVIPIAYVRNVSARSPHVAGWWEFGKSWSSFADLVVGTAVRPDEAT